MNALEWTLAIAAYLASACYVGRALRRARHRQFRRPEIRR